MRLPRCGIPVIAAAALLAASCSSAPAPRTTQSARPEVSVTTSSGTALGVRTTAVPNAAMALTAPMSVAGATYPSPIRVLASPVDIAAQAPVPAKGAILTFHLNQATIAPVEHPFIASRNPDGSWTPVPTQYNPTARTLSATLPHFSIWAPLSWSGDLLLAALKGGAQSIFGSTLDPAATPTCHATADLQVADSQPNGALRICATRTRPTGLRLTVVNTRRYPVDVSYPGGATVTVEPAADIATQVGAYINKVSNLADRRTVLPGHATATVELPRPGEGQARVSIDIDGIAYLTGILSVAIDELTLMSERLGSRIQANLEVLSARGCLQSAMTDLNNLSHVTDDAVTSLTKVAFSCAGDLFDTGASGAISDAIAVIAGLTDELAQSLYGLMDAATGASHHTLTVTDVVAAHEPVPAANLPARLSTDGYGPLQFGMTIAEAQAALGGVIVTQEAGVIGCLAGSSTAAPNVIFAVVDGRVLAAGVGNDPAQTVTTASGLHVGSSLADLKADVSGLTSRPYGSAAGYTEYSMKAASGRAAAFTVEDRTQQITGFLFGDPRWVIGVEFICV